MLHTSSSLEFDTLFGILNTATMLLTSLLCRTLPPIGIGNTVGALALLIPFQPSSPPNQELLLNKDCLFHLISPPCSIVTCTEEAVNICLFYD